MEYVEGCKITEMAERDLPQVDRKALADELFRGYLQQVLVDGCFHSDPHPGNLLLTCDHRIALMDFGMVTRVSPEMQVRLLKLLLAICDGLGEDAAHVAVQIGRPRPDFREDEFVERIASLTAEHHQKSMDQLEVGRVVVELQGAAGRCGLRIPHELTMMGKTLLNLDAAVSTLTPDFRPNEALRRRVSEILRHRTTERVSLTAAYNTLLEATEFAQKLPARANRIADLVSTNKLRVSVDALDEKRLMAGMQKIANRITVGLVLAALIVGAALLMRTDSTVAFTIATIFFVLAGMFGLILVFRAMFGDERQPPRLK
jgi:predicted unusual protein kinase regulating ubiquinone biosynthesis (AarF/ABC1/UbiB family)